MQASSQKDLKLVRKPGHCYVDLCVLKVLYERREARTGHLSLLAYLMRGVRRLVVARRMRQRLPSALQPMKSVFRRLHYLLNISFRQVGIFSIARSTTNNNHYYYMRSFKREYHVKRKSKSVKRAWKVYGYTTDAHGCNWLPFYISNSNVFILINFLLVTSPTDISNR